MGKLRIVSVADNATDKAERVIIEIENVDFVCMPMDDWLAYGQAGMQGYIRIPRDADLIVFYENERTVDEAS